MVSTNVNPFVANGLDIIAAHEGVPLSESQLAVKLGEREPMLSPLNLRCAAREALRQWPEVLRRIEETRQAMAALEALRQEEEARMAAIEAAAPIAA